MNQTEMKSGLYSQHYLNTALTGFTQETTLPWQRPEWPSAGLS